MNNKMLKIALKLIWYDLWIGFFYDRQAVRIYFCPLPCVVICIDLLEWVRSNHSKGRFKIREHESAVRIAFLVATLIYYAALIGMVNILWGS